MKAENKMAKLNDLTGRRFGRLLVISRAKNKSNKVRWNCICDCGTKKIVEGYLLTSGRIKSCGCYNRDIITKYKKIKYKGKYIPITSHPLFPIYNGIKNRCYNKNLPTYDRWGGRGIKMSEEWKNSFEQFVMDMGPRPSKEHSIDRIDNNKGYCKENCRWATAKEQANNARTNIKIEYKGKVRTLSETADFIGIPYHTLYHYFVVQGISDIDLIINFLRHKKGKVLSRKDLKLMRQVNHYLQDCICPILKEPFDEKEMVVDHIHKKHANILKSEFPGHIRGVIHRQVNSFEGKIANLMIRLGLHKFDITLPELLRNMAQYLEKEPYPYLHPSEAPKSKRLKKSSYNKLVKTIKQSKGKHPKIAEYPKSQKLTKPLERLFERFGIEPEFYKE